MPIVFQEFLNANEGRAYPLHDEATRQDINGIALPNDVLVDAHIWLPKSAGRSVFLSSVGITARLITLTFAATTEGTFCGGSSSSGSADFVPIATVSLVKPVVRFKNYKLEALYPGVGGWVAFGAAVNQQTPLVLLFNDAKSSLLLDRLVRAYDDIPVTSVSKPNVSTLLSGLVRLRGRSAILKTSKGTRVIGGVERTVALVGIDLAQDGFTKLSEFAGTCGHRPQNGDCNKAPLTQINNVGPDADGNIQVTFKGDAVTGGGVANLVVDFPFGLSQACIDELKLFNETCPPRESSSSSGESSSSSSPSDGDQTSSSSLSLVSSSSSSSSDVLTCPGNCYCENFEHGLGEMSVARGPMSIIDSVSGDMTKKLAVPAGILDHQFALNAMRPQTLVTVGDFFTLRAKLYPRDAQNGEGHFVFSWRNSSNFFFAGVTLKSSSDPSYPYPNGSFFIGKHVVSSSAWPQNLGLGYNFIAGARFHAPVALKPTEYDMTLVVSLVGTNLVELQLLVSYTIDGTPYVFNSGSSVIVPVLVAGQPYFNLRGNTGVGAVLSPISEFDTFGINCPFF